MQPEDVQAMLKAEPFVPLQVKTTDGSIYRITHPKLSMVTRQRLVLGSPDPENENLACDAVYLGWSVISSVEPLCVIEGQQMRPEEIQARLLAEPFEPFRLRLANGKTYDITLPNLTMATRHRLIVGFADPESNGRWADDCVWIGWPEILSVELLANQESVA